MKVPRVVVATLIVVFNAMLLPSAIYAQENCVPFGGTIYGWHNGASWFGTGDFTFGKTTLHASVVDPNTGLTRFGDVWLGTEEATMTFTTGEKITLMTSFITEHMNDAVANSGVFHVG